MSRSQTQLKVLDAATGKVLDTQKVTDTLDGKYYVYQVSGPVKFQLTGLSWLHATLGGVFFDPAPADATASGTSAKLLSIDEKTSGDWNGVYGKEGYAINGAPQKDPAYAKITLPQVLDKKELTWPEGIRRFSYRKRPDLPAGDHHDNVQIAFNVLPRCGEAVPHGAARHDAEIRSLSRHRLRVRAQSRRGCLWRRHGSVAPELPRHAAQTFFSRASRSRNSTGR